jgi:hypothetical protein
VLWAWRSASSTCGAAVEFEPALAAAVREGLQGLHVSLSPLFYANRTQVTAIAARAGLPAVYVPAFRIAAGDGREAVSLCVRETM